MEIHETRSSRAGWSRTEDEQLFSLAAAAQRQKAPLRGVFDEVALLTGRKPNSVRNYYYMRVRSGAETGFTHRRAFAPFTPEESAMLLEEVLRAQAQGESVRACTLRLAGGSDKAMLRYQNKYRSLLKNDAALVQRVMTDMEARGVPAVDPYALPTGRPRVGRPRKNAAPVPHAGELAILERLRSVEGLDVDALLLSLGTLAQSAMNGASAKPAPDQNPLQSELDALKHTLSVLQARYARLLGCFSQLVRLNASFLSQSSLVKVSSLSGYVRDLESNMQRCERLMAE